MAQLVKNLPYSAGDLGLIPGLGSSLGELATPVFWSREIHGLYAYSLEGKL